MNVHNNELKIIEHPPTNFPEDNSQQYYSLSDTGELFASSDSGLTWLKRSGPPSPGKIFQAVVAPSDSKALYVMILEPIIASGGGETQRNFVLYFSPDTGLTWEKHFEKLEGPAAFGATGWEINPIPGHTPANIVQLTKRERAGRYTDETLYISSDTGRTLAEYGKATYVDYCAPNPKLFYVDSIVIRLTPVPCAESSGGSYTLDSTVDGKSWQPLVVPEQGKYLLTTIVEGYNLLQ